MDHNCNSCRAKLGGAGMKPEPDGKIPSPLTKPVVGYVNGKYPLSSGEGEQPKFGVSKLNMAGKK